MYPTKVSIKDFLDGHEIRFESIHKPIYYSCLFKMNGKKKKAKICFKNGEIVISGPVVRRCLI